LKFPFLEKKVAPNGSQEVSIRKILKLTTKRADVFSKKGNFKYIILCIGQIPMKS